MVLELRGDVLIRLLLRLQLVLCRHLLVVSSLDWESLRGEAGWVVDL